jgi:endonuclease/exonuclease/phosphatase family metal-dependent hydrolase
MPWKILLALLFLLMIAGAFYFEPRRVRTLLATKTVDGPHLRILTWNIGYAELENDTRAHTSDLQAVAQVILKNDPDAVALQELTGLEQLKTLLAFLNGKYRGAIAPTLKTDRAEVVLVKDSGAQFQSVQAGGHYTEAAIFKPNSQSPEVALVSSHADAFNAAKRRTYTGELIEWARNRPSDNIVFVAGDFNFEVSRKDESHIYTDNLKHDSEAYSYILKYFRDLGRDAGDTAINDRRIDYIFGPSGTALLRRSEVIRGAAVGRMDHLPLLVEVVLVGPIGH